MTVNVLGSSITPELNSVQSNCESTTPRRGRVIIIFGQFCVNTGPDSSVPASS